MRPRSTTSWPEERDTSRVGSGMRILNELPQETIAGVADGGFVRDRVDDKSGAE